MRIFGYSDQHYGHQNIIKYCKRSLGEKDFTELTALEDAKAMIEAHNNTVTEDDMIIFGGDVSCSKQGREWIKKIIPKLKGRKVLVRGNHDNLTNKEYISIGFESVHDILVIGNLLFCHYPDHVQALALCREHNLILCAGHTHKKFINYKDNIRRVNLCVDVNGREPMLLGVYEDEMILSQDLRIEYNI